MRKREWLSAGRRRPITFTTLQLLALLCAFALTLIPSALLGGQSAHAAPQTTFYGITDSALLTSTGTATATNPPTSTSTSASTSTPVATATDTPVPTPTATDTPTPAPTATNTPTPPPTATPSGPPPNNLDVSAAANTAGWPQQNGNWCGIATVALIADYLNPTSPVSQNYIGGTGGVLNDPSSTSEWGAPSWISGVGPGVTADIARDFGTDPRSLAYGLTHVTGRQYHAIVDTNGAWDTTKWIVHDILTYRQPISVFVDHGQHSVIVSGVEATGNPLTDPGSITKIHVWDPGAASTNSAIQGAMHEAVPLSVWLGGNTDLGFAQYLKYPYSANQYPGYAYPFDPDPSVGPYTYVPSLYNHLWIGHYVYISPFGYVDPAGAPTGVTTTSYVSDWEFNQNGALIAGEASSGWPPTPTGYAGAVVRMPTNPPPPPPPVHVFSAKPLPKPKPKPVPKPTPVPTATPPRARPSPTAVPTSSSEAILPDSAAVPAPCASLTCALATMPPLWALYTFGGLLLVALLLAVVLLATRRSASARVAGVGVAGITGAAGASGVDAPLLPPALDDMPMPTVAASPEEPASAPDATAIAPETYAPAQGVEAVESVEPVIVPVVDANEVGEQTVGEEPHESDSL
ncbi:MAG TPA: hypothetical protein VFN78_08610 [Ktedonobacterales bacterium]|nr:hypothetical protein [Ktedonobacterales bacterium]